MNYYNVFVPIPVKNGLIYQYPHQIPIGSVVSVSVGSRNMRGFVLSSNKKPTFKVETYSSGGRAFCVG